jgi:uncharacterized protein
VIALLAALLLTTPSEEVVFRGASGLDLKGTLVLGKGVTPDRPGPAVLLLPGSGPTDRDGNQRPLLVTDLLKSIAERLGEEGVSSLRFDKRATPTYADLFMKDPPKLGEFMSWENFVGDARGALSFLRARPETDSRRIGIAGHSEGGLIALQVATAIPAEERPAGLALLATAGRTLDLVVKDQVALLMQRQNVPDTMQAQIMADLDRGIRSVVQSRQVPQDLHPGIAPLFPSYGAPLLHAYFTVDPAHLARQYSGTVVVVQGSMDVQVSPERDTRRLLGALEARTAGGHRLAMIEGASHNLKSVANDREPGFTGPVAPAAMEAVLAWALGLRAGVDAASGLLTGS